MASQWFIRRAGKIYGPYGRADISQLFKSGRLDDMCQFRQGTDGDWLTSAQLPGVTAGLPVARAVVDPAPILVSETPATARRAGIHPITWAALGAAVTSVVAAAVIGFVAIRTNADRSVANAAEKATTAATKPHSDATSVAVPVPSAPPPARGTASDVAMPPGNRTSTEPAQLNLADSQSTPDSTGNRARDQQVGSVSQPRSEHEAAMPRPAATDSEPPAKLHANATNSVTSIDESIVYIAVSNRSGIASGSGFVLDDSGDVVTSYHVINGATAATVQFHDQTRTSVLGVVAFSVGKDLAILRVQPAGHQVRALPLATKAPEKGERVLAFGSPRGLTGSVSDGVVSAIRTEREIRNSWPDNGFEYDLDSRWVQTTAPISHGNSGGPLVLAATGEVIAVNTWSRVDGQNLNFAISAEHVTQLLTNSNGKVSLLASLPRPKMSAEEKQEALQMLAGQIKNADAGIGILDRDVAALNQQQARDLVQLQVLKAAGEQRAARAAAITTEGVAISNTLDNNPGSIQSPALEAEARTRRQLLLAQRNVLEQEYHDLESAYYALQATVASRASEISAKNRQDVILQERRNFLRGQYQQLVAR